MGRPMQIFVLAVFWGGEIGSGRRVLSWRLSITMESSFCIEAVEEVLARFGKPGIFNTDQAAKV